MFRLIFTILLFSSGSASVWACLHGLASSSAPVKQSAQEAIILHDGETEELILSVNYTGNSGGSLAWIIPVPAVPTHYDTASTKLFQQVHKLVALQRDLPRMKSAEKSARSSGGALGIRLLTKVEVGPFKIQPIQGVGEAALSGLTQWLTSRGFAEPSRESISYYLERGWTFLAVHVVPPSAEGSLAERGALPPLRIKFPSSRIVYPLKFSTHMGVFSSRIYIFTKEMLPHAAFSGARDRGFEVVNHGHYLPTARFDRHPLRTSVAKVHPMLAPLALEPLLVEIFGADKYLYLSVLLSERVNELQIERFVKTRWKHVRFAPAQWGEDLAIPAPPAGEKLQGIE